jgi:hypothetical protein
MKNFKSIIDLLETFKNDQVCMDYLEKIRWNGDPVSPFDVESKVYNCKGNRYKCKNTGKYFNVRTGTIFDNTKIGLQKWFLAIYIVTSHKKGISSLQLSRDISVTQKTAWFMLQRIRNCFGLGDSTMFGEVEVDETYVGGDNRNKSKTKRKELHKEGNQTGAKHKTPVFGMLDRDNKSVKAKVIDGKAMGATLKPIIRAEVDKESIIISDGFGGYSSLHLEYRDHIIIKHDQDEYVKGRFHTNTIEGFWSLLKRGIIGIYHHTSPKHLQRYVDEFSFRYNTRDMGVNERFNIFCLNLNHRLTYKSLINK